MNASSTPSFDIKPSVLGGIGMMLLAMAIFSFVNAFSKSLLTTYYPWQVFFIRGFSAFAVLLPFVARDNFAMLRSLAQRPGLQIARVMASICDGLCFFTAVTYIPLADATTCYLAAPIFVTALSAIVLRERVGWRRWTAIAIGFAGVVIALRPSGAALSWPALIALAGCLFQSVFLMLTRGVRGTPGVVLSMTQVLGSCAMGGVLSFVAWAPPDLTAVLLLLASGVVNVCGMLCLNQSLRLAAASVVTPFQYTMLLWAIGLGYAVFGDVPSLQTLAGAAIVTAAGLYIFIRERTLLRREPEPSATPAA